MEKTIKRNGKDYSVSIVITSFNEPNTIGKAIDSFLNQDDLPENYELVVAAPDKKTHEIVNTYSKKNKHVKLFIDPAKGKSYALNLLLPSLKGNIIILSDGDVYVSKNSVRNLLEPFSDDKIGAVTGRPVSINSKNNILGYWSHLLCDAGAHEARKRRAKKGQFLECSGYLWAFRNKKIKRFPLDVAEDTVVPYLFREKGYKIAYASKAEVYVKFPTNFHDFVEQKKRTAKGHESLSKYVNVKKLPRTKSFKNEIFEGYPALFYPRNPKEVLWTFYLFPMRLYIWLLVFYHTKIKKMHYSDAWKTVKSTK
jgi:cellulose synthase/poly-beta-1,6-N-acetylglucosamine synthase-like glycosyltransferase